MKPVIQSGRFLLVVSAWAAIFVLLSVRLIDIQIKHGAEYRAQADENRFFSQKLVADRGVLLDRYQQPIMWNKRSYYRVENQLDLHPNKEFIDRSTALQLLATRSAEVGFVTQRLYRYPEALANTVGYVGPVTADDLAEDDTLSSQHTIGKLGLEKAFDLQLRGQDGSQLVEINALGQKQRVVKRTEPKSGQVIATSLDPELAEVAYLALGDRMGSVVINDASTGAILAMVTKPAFDANILSQVPITAAEKTNRSQILSQLVQDERKVFFNRAISGAYPPGSIFKLVTSLAGLSRGAITPDMQVVDEGTLKVGEYEYANWYFTQYGRTEGSIGLQRALARSNDIYFYKAAELTGPDVLAEMARQFGFGSKPGSELGGEASGLVPDPAWKEKRLGERWFLGNTYHMGIGQGDLLVTPLQIAVLGQTLANHGLACQPSFIPSNRPKCHELSLNDDQLKVVMSGMLDACSTGGTAFPFFPYNAQFRTEGAQVAEDLEQGAVACKTGTAEFGSADERGHRRTHGWFLAILDPQISLTSPTDPVKKRWWDQVQAHGFPQTITITVIVESDEALPFKEGSRDAAPVAKSIVDWLTKAEVTVSGHATASASSTP